MRIFTSWLRTKKISNFFRDAVEESGQKTDNGLNTRKEEQISRLLEIERMMLLLGSLPLVIENRTPT